MTEFQPFLFHEFEESPEGSLFDLLHAAGRIPLAKFEKLEHRPEKLDLERLRENNRIQGMLLGCAVGDSLGNTSEFRFDPASRQKKFGTIVDHLSVDSAGCLSDDAQTTFWTVERLLAKGAFQLDDLMGVFADRMHRLVGMGKNTENALARHRSRLRASGSLLDEPSIPADEGRGNGALMRFSPTVLPHLATPSSDLWKDAVLSAYATHPHATSLAANVAMVGLLWEVLSLPTGFVPNASWWLDEYLRIGTGLDTRLIDFPIPKDPIPRWFENFEGNLCDFVDGRLRREFQKGVPLRHACSLDGFGSRADVVQTVAAVLYVLMCHADSYESAIIASVNDTKDNDTIAAIVGAFLGALHGKSAIRQRWLDGIRSYSLAVEGRESMSDLEVMYRLSEEAETRFLIELSK